jgi:thioredoxin-like negative regulator of GroEL
MKLVSGVSLIVSVALFAQVWADTPEPESPPASEVSAVTTDEKSAESASSADRKSADEEGNEKKPSIRWQTDLKIAHEVALELNRPMLVVFDADWCSYCRKMERTTLSEPKLISQINNDFVPVHLNLDDHARIAEILEVKRIPCTVALSPRADLLGRLTGYVGLKQYGESLTRVLALHRKVEKQLTASTN